jgi:hypothetical protein
LDGYADCAIAARPEPSSASEVSTANIVVFICMIFLLL